MQELAKRIEILEVNAGKTHGRNVILDKINELVFNEVGR